MTEKIKISSIIIAKNEERNIERCLESQKGIIDEIVLIIDSRTTDKTLEIAQGFENVNAVYADWEGFANTKKKAIELTAHDWVFWIDADEELGTELQQELKYFKSMKPVCDAYSFPRKAFFLGKWIKHSGWYPGRVVRLFNKLNVCFNDKDVHEGLTINSSVGKFEFDINHYTDPNVEHYFDKFNNYTSLAAREMFLAEKSVSIGAILFRPLFIFIKMYILRQGFLDGIHGLILAIFSANYVFTKYIKLWELNKNENRDSS